MTRLHGVTLTERKGRGQLELTDEAAALICEHYGYRLTGGYIDRGQVFIGSDYVGTIRAGVLELDR
jgi:hypothetical protein